MEVKTEALGLTRWVMIYGSHLLVLVPVRDLHGTKHDGQAPYPPRHKVFLNSTCYSCHSFIFSVLVLCTHIIHRIFFAPTGADRDHYIQAINQCLK